MRFRAALLLFSALAGWPALAGAQPVVTSPAPDGLEVTVYRDPRRGRDDAMDLDWLNGFALVSERRRIRIPAGESVVRFEGVAGGIVPQSAIVTGFPDGIVERNRDAYLLSPATLLDRSLGRRVHLRRTSLATGQVREQEAVVRSGAGGAVVIETEDGIEALRCTGLPETLVYNGVPEGLSAKPTLSVRTRAAQPVEAVVTLSYLATGFDWQANYIAELSDDGRRMNLFAWLTLASTDETSFPNADTQAVAGRLNYTRAQVPPSEGGPLELRCWPQGNTSDLPLQQPPPPPAPPPPPPPAEMASAEAIVVTGSLRQSVADASLTAVQEELGDLKLYRIPEPVTVAANAQKQVALLTRENIPVQIVYRARFGGGNMEAPLPANRYLVTRNRTEEGLGVPLPSGGLVLFTEHRGQPFLTGEGRLDDRAVGEDVEIELGGSPGITFRAEQVGRGPDDRWIDYLLTASNDQAVPVRFEAELGREEDMRITSRTPLAERDGFQLWTATIPANGRV
ncbi:MAG TPA: hypothetical protein VGB54_14405, partial [Allosphingosinicella sp.]